MEKRRLPCPDDKSACKYAGTEYCGPSEHHLYPKRTADTPLKRRFGNLAINKVVACREVHDVLDTFPEPAYPENKTMRSAVYGT